MKQPQPDKNICNEGIAEYSSAIGSDNVMPCVCG